MSVGAHPCLRRRSVSAVQHASGPGVDARWSSEFASGITSVLRISARPLGSQGFTAESAGASSDDLPPGRHSDPQPHDEIPHGVWHGIRIHRLRQPRPASQARGSETSRRHVAICGRIRCCRLTEVSRANYDPGLPGPVVACDVRRARTACFPSSTTVIRAARMRIRLGGFFARTPLSRIPEVFRFCSRPWQEPGESGSRCLHDDASSSAEYSAEHGLPSAARDTSLGTSPVGTSSVGAIEA